MLWTEMQRRSKPSESAEIIHMVNRDEIRRKARKTRESNRIKELTYNGRTMTITEWAKDPEVVALGLDYDTLQMRSRQYHWSPERVLTTPKRNAGNGKVTSEDAPSPSRQQRLSEHEARQEQVRQLLAKKYTTADIEKETGFTMDFIRRVKRQMQPRQNPLQWLHDEAQLFAHVMSGRLDTLDLGDATDSEKKQLVKEFANCRRIAAGFVKKLKATETEATEAEETRETSDEHVPQDQTVRDYH